MYILTVADNIAESSLPILSRRRRLIPSSDSALKSDSDNLKVALISVHQVVFAKSKIGMETRGLACGVSIGWAELDSARLSSAVKYID